MGLKGGCPEPPQSRAQPRSPPKAQRQAPGKK